MPRLISLQIVAFAALVAAASADVIHLRDGSQVQGTIGNCDDDSCSIDKKPVDRDEIIRITLAGGATVPPGIVGLVLTDGTVKAGRLTDVSRGYVAIDDEEFVRRDVAEIALVARPMPAASPSPSGPIVRDLPGQPEAPPPPPAPQPAPAAPNTPPVASPPTPSNQPPRPGRLWIGTIIGRKWTSAPDDQASIDVTINVRAREYPRGGATSINDEGTVVSNAYRSRSSTETCTGSGTSNPITHPPGTWSSGIFRPPQASAYYVLAVVPAAGGMQTYRRTCSDGHETRSYDMHYDVVTAGRMPHESVLTDPEMRSLINGRMFGSYTTYRPDDVYPHTTASWSVCLEGAACPPPQPLDPPSEEPADDSPDDPCARAGQPQAFADTCGQQLDSMVAGLEPLFAEYNRFMQAAEANREAFDEVQRQCLAYEVAQWVLEAIITGGTGPSAKAAQALLELKDLIEKVQDGSIAEEFYPEAVSEVLDVYGDVKSLWTELTMDEMTRMQRDLDSCSGQAATGTYMKAKQFLEDLASSKRVWDTSVAPAINNVRGKGQECASLNHAAWRACFQEAECRGETPNCGPEPSLHGAYDP